MISEMRSRMPNTVFSFAVCASASMGGFFIIWRNSLKNSGTETSTIRDQRFRGPVKAIRITDT